MVRNFSSYLHLSRHRGVLRTILFAGLGWLLLAQPGFAQLGNSGSMEGVVKDPSGSSVAGAKVEILNPISGFHREAVTGRGVSRSR